MKTTDLHKCIAELEALVEQKDAKIAFLKEQFKLAQHKQFGKSSKSHPGQGELFNEAEELNDVVENGETLDISYTRKTPKRKPLPKDLPRVRIVHDIDEADKTCDCCAGTLHQLGEDSSEKLEFIPAQVKVIEHVRPKYACRYCEQNGTSTTIKQAPVPMSVIPKSYATPSLLS
jgi:transposase